MYWIPEWYKISSTTSPQNSLWPCRLSIVRHQLFWSFDEAGIVDSPLSSLLSVNESEKVLAVLQKHTSFIIDLRMSAVFSGWASNAWNNTFSVRSFIWRMHGCRRRRFRSIAAEIASKEVPWDSRQEARDFSILGERLRRFSILPNLLIWSWNSE